MRVGWIYLVCGIISSNNENGWIGKIYGLHVCSVPGFGSGIGKQAPSMVIRHGKILNT
jgi:hypothetical protein